MDLKTAIFRYCNYQERCHQEVKGKLYELGASTPEVDNLIADLIEAGLLNEERYARAFARGKFRIKRWGKIKIVQHLKRNRISDYCIKKGLSEIDGEAYYQTLQQIAARKWQELKNEKNMHQRKGKTYRFLQQRGFETGLITEVILELTATE